MALNELTARDLADKIAKKEVSACDAVRDVFCAIRDRDDQLKAYIAISEKTALEEAALVDRKAAAKEKLGALAGIPIAIKDNISTKGFATTCASKILTGYIPPYDATVIRKIKEADGIIIGKTNLDEFAMGSSTENSSFQTSRNPWDRERAPGGSSGGSAVAVSSREALLGLGSDTGGSIRQPASFCGIVGLKPTYGRVSRFGLVAFASSLDQIGVFAANAYDAALLLEVIAGHDPQDSTSAALPVPSYTSEIAKGIKGLRLGIPKEYFIEGIDPEVKHAIENSFKIFEKLGASLVDISLPHTEYCVATYYIIATAEASSNLARYDGVQYGYRAKGNLGLRDMYAKTRQEAFGSEVKRRILLGTYVLSSGYYDAYYLKAQKVRTLIKKDFDQAFEHADLILTPTSPTTAFKIGEKTNDPLSMYLSDIFTISANLAGIPGLSVPCGFDREGLPVGLQILGNAFSESLLLRAAYAFEQATDYHLQKPRLAKRVLS